MNFLLFKLKKGFSSIILLSKIILKLSLFLLTNLSPNILISSSFPILNLIVISFENIIFSYISFIYFIL